MNNIIKLISRVFSVILLFSINNTQGGKWFTKPLNENPYSEDMTNIQIIKPSPELPPEIWKVIFSRLKIEDYPNLRGTNTYFKQLIGNQIIKLDLRNFHTNSEINDIFLYQLVKTFPNLQILHLGYRNNITDTGLRYLSMLSNLRTLNLDGCNITDLGLQYLSNLKSLQSLRLLSCKKITDVGLQHLSMLKKLQDLHLSHCNKITDTGLLYFKDKNLQNLNLWGCENITDASLRYFRPFDNLTEPIVPTKD